jgi:hypothetical protein
MQSTECGWFLAVPKKEVDLFDREFKSKAAMTQSEKREESREIRDIRYT